ncbi:MAG: hypothetical protein KGZ39_03020 [Simkania sp.]|nr:hypothetical protein [Simkania sp.]
MSLDQQTEQDTDLKDHAPESAQTQRAREKLRRYFDDLDKKITRQALEKKSVEIHRWIARHAHHRVVLRSKTISLFDENQNTAKQSLRIAKIAQTLGNNLDKD